MASLWERLRAEFAAAFVAQERDAAIVQPTPEEARNGWTAEALTVYLAERAAAQSLAVDPNSLARAVNRRPDRQNKTPPPGAGGALKWRV